ncbi:MAG: sugar ABC transporter substrate-binding protein [Firmicutes bacterium]|nr:sugar ABC transporter substrate-binding protein [Bacillota bacterium]
MKKRNATLAILLALAMCLGLFAACGNNTTTTTAPPATTAAADTGTPAPVPSPSPTDDQTPVTISLMTLSSSDKGYFNVLADQFHALHPNITVNIINTPYDDFDSKLLTMNASGTGPDIFTHAQIMGLYDFVAQGMVMDMTPYIQKYGFDGVGLGIPQNVMDMGVVNGKTYGVPLNTYTSVMLYNKDLFDKAGVAYPPSDYSDASWTFDSMVQKAKDVMAGNPGTYGVLWDWSGSSPIQDPEYLSGMPLFNMDPSNPAYATSSNILDPKIIAAYQGIADAANVDKVTLSPSKIISLQGGNSDADPFITGNIAMTVGGAWIMYSVPDCPFHVGIAAIPIGANPDQRSVLYTDPYCINSASKHPDEAFQFIAFMAQVENQRTVVTEGEGNPPANTNALDAYYSYFSQGLDQTDMQNAITGALSHGVEDVEHLLAGSGQIHDLLYNELNDMYEGNETAAAACARIAPELDQLLQQIQADKDSGS